jgi:hypothetical protein
MRAFLLVLLLVLVATPVWCLEAEDEFLGPFSTWTNVQTTYGASGTCTAGDTTCITANTTALQTAFTALGTGGVHTLYFPAGTYLFSTKLRLIDKINVAILGADPATTILKWAGAAGEDLVYANAWRYSRLARVTLDGNSTARALWDQDWDEPTQGGKFDTGNEYLDVLWKNSTHGLWCGSSGVGCAETTVRRNTFTGIPGNCIQLWNSNALDMWVWDSAFTGCGRGVTNAGGAGAFRVYRSLFQASTIADMEMGNTQVFSARDNFSVGSDRFWKGTGTGNAGPVVLHANTVIDSVQNDTIQVANQGPLLLFDNVIRVKSGGAAPLVTHAQAGNSDTVSFSNTYTVTGAVSVTGRLLADGDTVVSRASIAGTVPTMPDVAVSHSRTVCGVCDVPPGSSSAIIQAAINGAVALGNKAVVHLQAGTSTLTATLTIPAGADIQIAGDGYQTSVLSWGGASNVPMLSITGPTKVRLQDVELRAQNTTDGIVMEGVDQTGARIHVGQVQFRQGYGSHLLVQGMNRAQVEWVNSNSAYMTDGIAVQVVGGTAPTIFYSGASSWNKQQYIVSAGGTLVARDMYYETDSSPSYAAFTDRGSVVLDSHRIHVPALGANPGIALTNWQGPAIFLGSTFDDRFVLSGTGTFTEFLGLGMNGIVSPYLVDTTAPAAAVVLASSRRRITPGGSESTTNVPTVVDASAIQGQTAFVRSFHPLRMTETAAGVSDIRLQRVWIRDARNAVTVVGTPETPVPAPLRLVR